MSLCPVYHKPLSIHDCNADTGSRDFRRWYSLFIWICHHFADGSSQTGHLPSVQATGDSHLLNISVPSVVVTVQ